VIEILALLAVLPLVLLFDVLHLVGRWRMFIQRQQPRDAELLRASHGAAVLVIVALALYAVGVPEVIRFIDALRAAPADPWHFLPALAVAGVVLWGVLWLASGARRSLTYKGRDSRLLTRAGVKILFGGAVWSVLWHPPASWAPDVLLWIAVARSVPYSRFALVALIAWLTVTGCTRFLLVAVPMAGNALRIVARQQRQRNVAMIAAGGRRSRARSSWIAFGAVAVLGFWFLL
jgi:hypothetical protein